MPIRSALASSNVSVLRWAPDYHSFIELHIEQGRSLLDLDKSISILEAIAGIKQLFNAYCSSLLLGRFFITCKL